MPPNGKTEMAHLKIILQVGPREERILTVLFPDGEEFDKTLARVRDTLPEEAIVRLLKQDEYLAQSL